MMVCRMCSVYTIAMSISSRRMQRFALGLQSGGTFAGTKVAIIGDSVTHQAGDGWVAIPAAFTLAGWPTTSPNTENPKVGTWFYGRDGKQIADPDGGGLTTMQNIADCRASQFGEPDVWVIALCTNNGSDPVQDIISDMQTVLSALGNQARVVWVNIGTSDPYNPNHTDRNQAIANVVQDRPHTMLADWNRYLIDYPDQTNWWADYTHMTPLGYTYRNNFIAQKSIEAYSL